jgi:hypothetical protein
MTLRELTQAARCCLERSQTAEHPTVREIMLTRADRFLAMAEVLLHIGISGLPLEMLNAIIDKRSRVVAVCPPVTQAEMLKLNQGKTIFTKQGRPSQPEEKMNHKAEL